MDSGRPRALLIINPRATTTDTGLRDLIAAALSSAVDLEVASTKQRGHAAHLAAGAVHDGADLVFVLGGDGTANEAIQSLATTPVVLGLVPGGGTNVLARALGLPNDAVAATTRLIAAVRAGRTRTIGLGRAHERWFGFNAGLGFDGAVVRHVEQHDRLKRSLRQGAFVWSTAREWAIGPARRTPMIEVTLADGRRLGPVSVALVANTDPYTYLGPRALHLHPRASFDRGLDLVTIDAVPTTRLLAAVAGAFRDGRHVDLPGIGYHHDQASLTLASVRPQPLEVDGDYAGEHREVPFVAVPEALTVLV
jgi:diacylglycerol kinase family enzyme